MEPTPNRLFLPSARQTNVLLIVGFGALGYALYVRYMGIEQSAIGLACNAGLDTFMCLQRKVWAALFDRAIIGWAAVIIAAVNLMRPTLVVFGLGLAIACIGVVLYNVMLSALAIGLLLLSLARRAPEPD